MHNMNYGGGSSLQDVILTKVRLTVVIDGAFECVRLTGGT